MNKFYTLISIGLIASNVVFTSCSKDEKIINDNPTNDIWEENLKDYTVKANIIQPEALQTSESAEGRATVSNDKYIWQANDKFTLWNKNMGRGSEFIISPDFQPSSSTANFIGKATLSESNKLIAVYPAREIKSFNDLKTFTMPESVEQTSAEGGLSNSSFMIAEAVSGDIAIPELNFKPLTALLQFNLKNITDKEISIKSLTISADDKVFPSRMTINDNGEITNLDEAKESITLNFKDQSIAAGETYKGYLNILPTTFGDVMFMSDDTKITVKANISVTLSDQTYETEVRLLNNKPVKEFKDIFSYDIAETAYQFASGRYYPMNFEVDYHTYIPAEGYIVDEDGNLEIYTPTGFNHWKESGETYKAKTVTLLAKPQSEIVIYKGENTYNEEFAVNKIIDLSNSVWTPLEFTGTFEGEEFTIRNFKIRNTGGFFKTINGTVNNLNISNVTYEGCNAQAGAFAESNSGKINNCTVSNVTMGDITANSPVGGFVAENKNTGVIDNCSVSGITGTLIPTYGNNQKANLGGIAGENNGSITNSKAIGIEINHTRASGGKSNVGGLVGFNNVGKIKGCYAEAKLTWSCSATIGGLVGANASAFIQASYAYGSIQSESGAAGNVGGLLGENNAGKCASCYSTIEFTGTLPAQKGGICGWDAGQKGVFNECYSLCQEGMSPVSNNPSAGTKAENAQKIADDVRFFNYGLERLANFNMDVLPDVKVSFKKNENTETSANQPIILINESVTEPGFGGPDFGDGGSI